MLEVKQSVFILMNSAETFIFSSFSTKMILFVAVKMVLAEIASAIIAMPS
jgi:hypothetical protein